MAMVDGWPMTPSPICQSRQQSAISHLRCVCYDRRNSTSMLPRQAGLAGAILGANLRSPEPPYKVTFVATYHCNFRCEMCNIWQKKSVNEMTPAEVSLFFEKWPQFK